MESHFARSRIIWEPKQPSNTSLDTLRRLINLKHGLNLSKSLHFTIHLRSDLT